MAKFDLFYFFFISMGCVFAEENGVISNNREPRHVISKLCYKFGLCGGGYQGGQGFQGGYGGYQGGYGGYPSNSYPPINIGISQSQSSSSAGGGGYGSAAYPNNYQYNNGYPQNGYHYNGYSGYNRPGYFGNGYGSYNNQFNGNYYGSKGGYGFQKPFGFSRDFYDDRNPNYEDYDEEYGRSNKD